MPDDALRTHRASPRQLALAALLAVLGAPRRAEATVVGCRTFDAGKVHINHCVNHDYYPRTEPIRLRLAAAGLEALRARLVRAGRLDDRPVLVELRWMGNQLHPQTVALEAACVADPGDTDQPGLALGRCIHVDMHSLPRTWSTWRTALVAATHLTEDAPTSELVPLDALARRVAAGAHRDVKVVGETHPAPHGALDVQERWRDGELSLVLRKNGEVRWRLPKWKGELTATPVWSADGETVVVATLDEVVAYRMTDARVRRFDVAGRLPKDATHFDTKARVTEHGIEITADTAMLSAYRRWRWDPATGQVDELDAPVAP